MGRNFESCCHRCEERMFHFRGEESEGMHQFYRRHYECMKIDPNNVQTLDDQMQEKDWMRDRGRGRYTSVKRV